MRKILLCLAVLILMLCAFAADSENVRVFFPAKVTDRPLFPVDAVIGQTCSVSESDEHQILYEMLLEPYTFEWTQSHIREQERSALVKLFGSWLSDNLGSSDVLMSTSLRNSDKSVTISVRVNGSCMAFVLKDGLVISMKAL